MDSPISTPILSPEHSNKKKYILAACAAVVIALGAGIYMYKWWQSTKFEREQQQMLQEVAQAAAQVHLSDEERAKAIKDVQNEPSVTLPSDEAKAREAEIINNTGATQ